MARDNYAVQAELARQLFARQDMDRLCRLHGLTREGDVLHLRFCSEPYTIRCSDGTIFRENGEKAAFSEVLSICDLLTQWDGAQQPAGQWCTVYSLPHTIRSGSSVGPANRMEPSPLTLAQFHSICSAIGTPEASKADASYRIPIFGRVEVLVQYWEADDEFPAQLQILWDRNAQAFLFFETMFYVMGYLGSHFGLR